MFFVLKAEKRKKMRDSMVRPTEEHQNQGKLNNFEMINKMKVLQKMGILSLHQIAGCAFYSNAPKNHPQ